MKTIKIVSNLSTNTRKAVKSDILVNDANGNFKQILIGSYLGDGSYLKVEGKHSRFSLAHSKKQYDYFMYKYKFFELVGLEGKVSENRVEHSRYKEGFFEEVRFRSKPNIIFDEYRTLGYGEKGKKLNINLVKDINVLGLSIWFMDDGNRTNDSCEFNCQSHTEDEKYQLKELIESKFEFKLNVTKGTLYVPKEYFQIFKETIQNTILDSLKYKLEPYKGSV